jgi:hypothetical protein
LVLQSSEFGFSELIKSDYFILMFRKKGMMFAESFSPETPLFLKELSLICKYRSSFLTSKSVFNV